jgi:hypothetical protein
MCLCPECKVDTAVIAVVNPTQSRAPSKEQRDESRWLGLQD